jgi:hypothetical protein
MKKPPPKRTQYVPFTPGCTCLIHLAASTEDKAWERLLKDATADAPLGASAQGKEEFKTRGYTVERLLA